MGSVKVGGIGGETFMQWFEEVLLPNIAKLPGRKVYLGCHVTSRYRQPGKNWA